MLSGVHVWVMIGDILLESGTVCTVHARKSSADAEPW